MKKLLTLLSLLISINAYSQAYYINETIINPSNCKSNVEIAVSDTAGTLLVDTTFTIYGDTTLKYKVLLPFPPITLGTLTTYVTVSTSDSICWCYDDLMPPTRKKSWSHDNMPVTAFDALYDTITECSPLAIVDNQLPKFSFYPNPANSKIVVTLPKYSKVSIMSIDGRIWYSKYMPMGCGSIDVSGFVPGTYYLIVDNVVSIVSITL